MKRSLLLSVAVAVLWPMLARAQNAKAALDAAASALGATNLKSIEFSGRGFDFMFGQAYDPNSPWPRFSVPRYTVSIDYATPAIRDDRTRTQIQNPPHGLRIIRETMEHATDDGRKRLQLRDRVLEGITLMNHTIQSDFLRHFQVLPE